MWLWDYIMLIRQRQETRRNVRVPLVYLGIGENAVIMAKVAIFQNRSLYTLAKITLFNSSAYFNNQNKLCKQIYAY